MAAKKKNQSREASLQERAASRGYTVVKEGGSWYVALGGTRWGPMRSLDEVDEFLLPKEQ